MKFLFRTITTMKPYNNKKWWIDSGFIRDMRIKADTLDKAVEEYRDRLWNEYCIEISKTAIKEKNNNKMFYDDKEGNSIWIGYVFTGKMDFQNDDTGKWSKQFIDLWADIEEVRTLEEIA